MFLSNVEYRNSRVLGYKGPEELVKPSPEPEPEKPKKGRKPNYRWILVHILVTLLLLGGTVGLLKGFETLGALPKRQKYVLNTVIIGLSLYLGFNITVSEARKPEKIITLTLLLTRLHIRKLFVVSETASPVGRSAERENTRMYVPLKLASKCRGDKCLIFPPH